LTWIREKCLSSGRSDNSRYLTFAHSNSLKRSSYAFNEKAHPLVLSGWPNRQLYRSYEKKKAKSGNRPERCQAIGKTCHTPCVYLNPTRSSSFRELSCAIPCPATMTGRSSVSNPCASRASKASSPRRSPQADRMRLTPASSVSGSIDHGRRPAHTADSPVSRKNIGHYCIPRLLSRSHSA
jgi:hypothetical protein